VLSFIILSVLPNLYCFSEGLCFPDPWLRDHGGNGRTELLHYIAGLHLSCYSYGFLYQQPVGNDAARYTLTIVPLSFG